MRNQYAVTGNLVAFLDDSETAPSLGTGQPLVIKVSPTSGPLKVATCPDGEVPALVISQRPASASSTGTVCPVAPGAPIYLGGTVAKGDKLAVDGGAFIKAVTGKVCVCAASSAGVAGDIIMAAALSVVA